jgi:energy-coupling factor transport system permease protein
VLVTWKYRPRDTFLQKLDPRARILYLACVTLALTLSQVWDFRLLLPVCLISLALYFTGRLPWKDVRRAWTLMLLFITLILGLNALLSGRGGPMAVLDVAQQTIIYQSGALVIPVTGWTLQLTLTVERVWFAATQMVRILSMVALAIPIPYTVDPSMYGVTFRRMGLPDKASQTIDLAFRFVPTLGRDFTLTMDAQRARGFELEQLRVGPFERLRRLAPLIVPVVMLAIVSGEDVVDAMDLRAFGTRPRTWLRAGWLRFRPADYALLGLGVALMVGFVALRLSGYGGFWVPPVLFRMFGIAGG